jgi:hypothetical protein
MKVLVTSGSPDRPFGPELEEAEEARKAHETAHSHHRIKVRTYRSKSHDSLKREFWAVPIPPDPAPGEGKSHAARARAKQATKQATKPTKAKVVVS